MNTQTGWVLVLLLLGVGAQIQFNLQGTIDNKDVCHTPVCPLPPTIAADPSGLKCHPICPPPRRQGKS